MSSFFDAITNPVVFGPIVFFIVLIAVVRLFIKNYVKVPSNKVAVFTGRGKQEFVTGGARFRIPGLVDVREMSLEPFPVSLELRNAPSDGIVPVNVDAVGLIRFGSSAEMLATAVGRWLDADPNTLQALIKDQLEGSLRAIVATMSVEDLNSNRDELSVNVIQEAGEALRNIGLEVDTFKIQSISDNNGFLEALGQGRIAEVKRDATIAQANADREARTSAAQARRDAEIAEAQARTAIADAERERDIKLAANAAQVNAEQARAEQAGPLAKAEATKAVGVAEETAEAARVEARTAVQEKRVAEQTKRLEAEVVAPAEAERQAAIARAQGQREATILEAEADARQATLAGESEATARKAKAAAEQVELEAKAAGKLAELSAEAEGQAKMADSLNAFSEEAIRLQILPKVLESLVQATGAAAQQVGNIDSISVIGGGSDSKGGLLGGIDGIAPNLIAKTMAVLNANGVNVAELINGLGGQSTSSTDGQHDTPPSLPSTEA